MKRSALQGMSGDPLLHFIRDDHHCLEVIETKRGRGKLGGKSVTHSLLRCICNTIAPSVKGHLVPPGKQPMNRRRQARNSCNLVGRYDRSVVHKTMTTFQTGNVAALDRSGGGMLLNLRRAVAPGKLIEVTFQLPHQVQSKTILEIRWLKKSGDDMRGCTYLAGCKRLFTHFY